MPLETVTTVDRTAIVLANQIDDGASSSPHSQAAPAAAVGMAVTAGRIEPPTDEPSLRRTALVEE